MQLTPKPLNAEDFAPFGDVIDTQTTANSFKINYGLTTRFHDMAHIDVTDGGGKAGFSIFRASTAQLPHQVKVMEYHPHGSQLFYPLCKSRFLILVAPISEKIEVENIQLFITNGKQGINYHKGVWHHYLLPLNNDAEFVVIDRIASDENCVEENIEGITIDLQ